jgi:hypothetical protein
VVRVKSAALIGSVYRIDFFHCSMPIPIIALSVPLILAFTGLAENN